MEFDPGGMEKALIASARRSLGANDVSWNREWMFLLLFVSVFRFRTNVDSALKKTQVQSEKCRFIAMVGCVSKGSLHGLLVS